MRYIIVLVRDEDGAVYFWNVNEQAFLQVLTMGCVHHTAQQAEDECKHSTNLRIINQAHSYYRGKLHILPTSL